MFSFTSVSSQQQTSVPDIQEIIIFHCPHICNFLFSFLLISLTYYGWSALRLCFSTSPSLYLSTLVIASNAIFMLTRYHVLPPFKISSLKSKHHISIWISHGHFRFIQTQISGLIPFFHTLI